MEKTTEVELRGLIDKDKYLELIEFFKKNGRFKKGKNRILIDYSTYLPEQGIRERKKDIRLRVTNGVPEIIVKLGSWGGSENRKELSVLAKPGEFDKLVEIFGAIGLTKGVLCVRNSQVFEYKEIEFALVEVPNHSYYFEAEKMIGADEDGQAAKREIEKVIEELDLKLFSDEEFFKYIEKLNSEANEVFDFEKYTEGDFERRFGLKK